MFFFLLAFGASMIGGLCGIGGGILMKPAMDFFHMADPVTASFLSSCTVFFMALCNVSVRLLEKRGGLALRTTFPLAVGAAMGGVLGNQAFAAFCRLFPSSGAGRVQSAALLILTAFTLFYTVKRSSIRTVRITAVPACAVIGLGLGSVSSFLGIGGGPFNLVVLHYFFSMQTKTAAASSLFIILLSQTTNLISYAAASRVPAGSPAILGAMVLGGVSGGVLSSLLNKKIHTGKIEGLFILVMMLIMLICIYNIL